MPLLPLPESGFVCVLARLRSDAETALARSEIREKCWFDFGATDHWSRVEEEWKSRQANNNHRWLFYTQNPLVFDCMTFSSADDLRRRVLLVRDAELANMTEEQRQSAFDAYEAGIQYVSEILYTHGLW